MASTSGLKKTKVSPHMTQYKTKTLSALLFAAALPASAQDYFFFGDSLTDNGNLNLATGGLAPGPGYPTGTYSNGSTWADYISPNATNAATLINPMAPIPGSVNFAFAGAETSAGGTIPGLLDQVGQFGLARPLLSLTPDDYATVWAGANDLLDIPAGTEQARAAAATTNIATAVNTLVNTNGVQNVLVFNLPDLGATPRTIAAAQATMNPAI